MSWMDEWMDPIICPKLDKPKTASLFFNSCFPRMLYLMLWLSWCQYIEITFELCWNCVIVVAKREKKGGGASLQEIDCVISHLWGLLNHKNNDITHKSDLRLCLPPSLPLVFSLRFTLGISCRQCCFGKKFNWYSSFRQHSHLLSNCFLTSTLHVSLHICLTLSLPSSKYAKYICSYLPVKGN